MSLQKHTYRVTLEVTIAHEADFTTDDVVAYVMSRLDEAIHECGDSVADGKAEHIASGEAVPVFLTADGCTLYFLNDNWVDSTDPASVDLCFEYDAISDDRRWPIDSNGDHLDGAFVTPEISDDNNGNAPLLPATLDDEDLQSWLQIDTSAGESDDGHVWVYGSVPKHLVSRVK